MQIGEADPLTAGLTWEEQDRVAEATKKRTWCSMLVLGSKRGREAFLKQEMRGVVPMTTGEQILGASMCLHVTKLQKDAAHGEDSAPNLQVLVSDALDEDIEDRRHSALCCLALWIRHHWRSQVDYVVIATSGKPWVLRLYAARYKAFQSMHFGGGSWIRRYPPPAMCLLTQERFPRELQIGLHTDPEQAIRCCQDQFGFEYQQAHPENSDAQQHVVVTPVPWQVSYPLGGKVTEERPDGLSTFRSHVHWWISRYANPGPLTAMDVVWSGTSGVQARSSSVEAHNVPDKDIKRDVWLKRLQSWFSDSNDKSEERRRRCGLLSRNERWKAVRENTVGKLFRGRVFFGHSGTESPDAFVTALFLSAHGFYVYYDDSDNNTEILAEEALEALDKCVLYVGLVAREFVSSERAYNNLVEVQRKFNEISPHEGRSPPVVLFAKAEDFKEPDALSPESSALNQHGRADSSSPSYESILSTITEDQRVTYGKESSGVSIGDLKALVEAVWNRMGKDLKAVADDITSQPDNRKDLPATALQKIFDTARTRAMNLARIQADHNTAGVRHDYFEACVEEVQHIALGNL